MPLVDIWKTNPDTVYCFSIEQIISTAGDGNLRDFGDSSNEFRTFLRGAPSEKLFEYIEGCLVRSFTKSGQALQDLINELGRRLDYDVENGLYQGKPKHIGFVSLSS